MKIFNQLVNKNYIIAIAALAAILVAGALYADKIFVPPEPPPNIIQTIKGPVVLYEDAEPGEVITAPNLGTIYYLNKDKERVVFPDEQTFLSWYPNYDAVKTIPRDVLEGYDLAGRNATIRPGTKLITIPSSNQVWAVGFPNNVFWLKGGEEMVAQMYGPDWANRVVDLPEYYFVNYQVSTDIDDPSVYPPGTLLYSTRDDQYYLVVSGGVRLLTASGIEENHFQLDYAISIDRSLQASLSGPEIDAYDPLYGSPDIEESSLRVD